MKNVSSIKRVCWKQKIPFKGSGEIQRSRGKEKGGGWRKGKGEGDHRAGGKAGDRDEEREKVWGKSQD